MKSIKISRKFSNESAVKSFAKQARLKFATSLGLVQLEKMVPQFEDKAWRKSFFA